MYVGVPAAGATYNVSLTDIDDNILSSTSIVTPASATFLSPFDVTWNGPIVFDRVAVNTNVSAAAGVRLGAFQLPVSQSGFTSRAPGN